MANDRSRMENLLLAIDSAATPERFARLPAVLRTVAATLTPPRIERAFMVSVGAILASKLGWKMARLRCLMVEGDPTSFLCCTADA